MIKYDLKCGTTRIIPFAYNKEDYLYVFGTTITQYEWKFEIQDITFVTITTSDA